jgi:hypothetical protein
MQIKYVAGTPRRSKASTKADLYDRVRTLTGKEIELDIEADYKVRFSLPSHTPTLLPPPSR